MLRDMHEQLSSDAYWLRIEPADLIEIPPTMFMGAGTGITKMEPYATNVFERVSEAPIGDFFFLVDRQRDATLCAYAYMDQASKPIWVDGVDLQKAASEIKLHCRRNDWRLDADA